MSHLSAQFISTAQYAKALGISVVAVFKRIQKKQIKAVKIGRSYVIPREYLNDPTGKFIQPSINTENYVSVMQAAEILGITRMAVFNKIKSSHIQAEQVGRHYIIARSQLDQSLIQARESTLTIHKEFLSVPELAEVMGVSRIAIFKKVQQGLIKAHKVGRHYVIASKDVSDDQQKHDGDLDSTKDQISIVDAAKKMGVSRIAVFKRIQKGQLRAQKIGRSYAINRQDLDEYQHIVTKGGNDV